MITLKFDIEPQPKLRPRMTRRGHVYTPAKTAAFENAVKLMAKTQFKDKPFIGPLHVVACFYFKRPKSVKRIHHTVKPDCDNLIKAVYDSLNGICWVDDAQIVTSYAHKFYADKSGITIGIKRATA